MDLGCKLIRGEWAPGRATIPAPFAHRGVCTEIFSTFLFFASKDGVGGGRGGTAEGWGVVCRLLGPPGTPTNAVSVFSLSLSRACTPVPTWPPGPSHAGGAGRRLATPPVPARGGGTSTAARRLTTDSCCTALGGLSVLGSGRRVETVPRPQPPTPAVLSPGHHRSHADSARRGPRRPPRDPGWATSAALVSSPWPPPPSTPVFLLVCFPSLPPPPAPHPSLVQHR